MLFIISPAKTLDETSPLPDFKFTTPELLDESKQLVSLLRKKSPEDLQELMGISHKLAELNYTRFKQFNTPFTTANARPALLTFKGDVYAPLTVADYGKKEWDYASRHLRMLSGLYGVLRPLDLMQAYRLEMGTALANKRGRNLYEFWGNKISRQLNTAIADSGSDVLVNLASEEYFKAVDQRTLKARLLHIVFKEHHKGTLKIIAIHAKRARGLMVEYAIQHKLAMPEQLKKFDSEGYQFDAKMSDANRLVFVRSQ